jgi:hypothetical protein
MTRVLLMGRTRIDLIAAGVMVQAESRGIELFGGTSLEDVREVLAQHAIDAVIMGGGIPIEDRLAMIRHIYEVSETTTVHLKDRASGPKGMLPFVKAVLKGLG